MVTEKKVISVIGLGYVGLTTAVGFALRGHKVIGVDIDPEKVRQICNRNCPIYEEGLIKALEKAEFIATSDTGMIIDSDITFMCGGTPPKNDGSIDLFFLEEPVMQLAEVLKAKKDYHVIVVRSTVIPGTIEKVITPRFSDTQRFGICANPEFLREGTALEDFMKPSRIVIGANDQKSGDILHCLYSDFNSPIIRTNIKTAEMIKQASNAYLATRISFINEIGNTCRYLGIDVYEVAKGMGYDPRIGNEYLNAGLGFGGFCLPKDLSALIALANEVGYKPRVLESVQRVNIEQPKRMLNLLKKRLPSLEGKVIGILGLAFKPGTDDVRTSKAIDIVELLLAENAIVKVYDPKAMHNFKKVYPNHIQYSAIDEVMQSDAILILTEWEEFYALDFSKKVVIDGRRVPKAKEARIYEGICW